MSYHGARKLASNAPRGEMPRYVEAVSNSREAKIRQRRQLFGPGAGSESAASAVCGSRRRKLARRSNDVVGGIS